MSRPLWFALGALVGTVGLIKLIETVQEADLEEYKKMIAADAIKTVQENLTQPIVKL